MFGTTKTATEAPAIVFAASTFSTVIDGAQVVLRACEPWSAEDGLVKRHPEWFVTDPADCDGGIRRSSF